MLTCVDRRLICVVVATCLPSQVVSDTEFLNYRPSILAAAVLYTARQARGMLPLWPTVLTLLTGCNEANTPELFSAITATQRQVAGRGCACMHAWCLHGMNVHGRGPRHMHSRNACLCCPR